MQKKAMTAPAKSPATVTELRKSTPMQKRQIIGILEDVYDDNLKRYRGKETDKSVAETIGINVMPGWVAEIREDMFGPDASNDEMETLLAEMREWRAARQKEAHNARIHLENAEGTLALNFTCLNTFINLTLILAAHHQIGRRWANQCCR